MRLIVFFDLPILTAKNRSDYAVFRKYLIKNGFIMMQKSVYVKLALNSTVMHSIKTDIKRNVPPEGLIEMLEITEKQFNQIEYLSGEKITKTIDTDKRLVIL